MSSKDLISVIIRTKDRPKLLKRALHSVKLQTYSNLEILIINDGGQSLKSILPGNDFKLIELENNHGRSAAANMGIENVTGKYIAFLDDDDFFYPNHFEVMSKHFSEQKVLYTDALKRVEKWENFFDNFLEYSFEFNSQKILHENFIPFQCLLFPAQDLKDNLLDTSLTVYEDWDLLIRLSKKYDFVHIKEITSEYSYRMEKSNTTGSNKKLWKETKELILKRYGSGN